MLGWEPVAGQQVGLGVRQQPGDLGSMRSQLVDDLTKPSPRLGGGGSNEDLADRARHQRLLRPADVAEHVAQEVDGAALPGQPST